MLVSSVVSSLGDVLVVWPKNSCGLALSWLQALQRAMAARAAPRRLRVAPCLPQRAPLDSLPGGEASAAWALRGARGTARRRCGAAARWASGAQGRPGTNTRAGQRRPGRPGPGPRAGRRLWGHWAWAARQPPTLLGPTVRRRAARRGGGSVSKVEMDCDECHTGPHLRSLP